MLKQKIFISWLLFLYILLFGIVLINFQGITFKFSLLFLNYVLVIAFYITYLNQKKKDTLALNLGNFLSFYIFLNLLSFLGMVFTLIFEASSVSLFTNSLNFYFMIEDIWEIIFIILFITLFYFKDFKSQFLKFFKNIFSTIAKIIIYFGLALVFNLIFAVISAMIPLSENVSANQEAINGILGIDTNIIFFLLSAAIIAPIAEEIFFRYILLEKIVFKLINPKKLRFFGIVLLTIISASIFAFMHAIAASSLIYFLRDLIMYLGVSLVLCYSYIRERNIYLTICLHSLINTLSLIAFYHGG